ncbi:hypothetical protein EB230_09415 [Mesorhizobium sp. NZP2234]|nr:hypothetical protein EB230_09415 [Mesorhizobium sp. NZP2234]
MLGALMLSTVFADPAPVGGAWAERVQFLSSHGQPAAGTHEADADPGFSHHCLASGAGCPLRT